MTTQNIRSCCATLVAAPSSGQGKTVITAALARSLVNQGRTVQVFKIGPDFLDPMILRIASGRPVWNLDWWMMGEAACRRQLCEAAEQCDVLLIEGLMGLYDNEPSNADISRALDLPVTLVMDMAKFAQTAAAVIEGMQRYEPRLRIAAVIGNRLGSAHHQALVREAMSESVHYAGSLRRDDRLALAERHLGLVQASEIDDLSDRLDQAAACLEESRLDLHIGDWKITAPVAEKLPAGLLAGKRIAIARDDAFRFIYRANVSLLEALGATLLYFSPLADEPLPDCDAVWLPGGYPELHLAQLSQAKNCFDSLHEFIDSGGPGLAECGGMMVLGREILDKDGNSAPMAAVFDGRFTMHQRFRSVGYQYLEINGLQIRGHSFHHSAMATGATPVAFWRRLDGSEGEALLRHNNMMMTYGHGYFASSPSLIASWFGAS